MTSYRQIADFEDRQNEWTKSQFLTERALFEEMMNDILVPISRGVGEVLVPQDDSKDPVLLLMARLVNDFEAPKRLILMGLGEQAYQSMRDSVETSLLLLLFQLDEKLAMRWMLDLKQYTAGNTIAQLRKYKVDYPLGEMYSMLSVLSHPNFLASMHVVEEVKVGEDHFLRTYHFGGYRNAGFIKLQFGTLLVLMMVAVLTALPSPFAANDPEYQNWLEKVQYWPQRLKDALGLDVELSINPVDDDATRQVALRLKLDLFTAEAVQKAHGTNADLC